MTVQELILVRHGQSEGNVAAEKAQRVGVERIDVPARDPDVVLSETGRDIPLDAELSALVGFPLDGPAT